jgi:hypothetical protein
VPRTEKETTIRLKKRQKVNTTKIGCQEISVIKYINDRTIFDYRQGNEQKVGKGV